MSKEVKEKVKSALSNFKVPEIEKEVEGIPAVAYYKNPKGSNYIEVILEIVPESNTLIYKSKRDIGKIPFVSMVDSFHQTMMKLLNKKLTK